MGDSEKPRFDQKLDQKHSKGTSMGIVGAFFAATKSSSIDMLCLSPVKAKKKNIENHVLFGI